MNINIFANILRLRTFQCRLVGASQNTYPRQASAPKNVAGASRRFTLKRMNTSTVRLRGTKQRPPIQPSKAAAAYDIILERIIQGVYVPGQHLVITELVKEIGISAIPTREAVRLLEAEGFVVVEHRRGVKVAALSETELVEMTQLLAILEAAATGLSAPHLGATQLDEAEHCNVLMEQAVANFDVKAFTAASLQFHEIIQSACPNQHLLKAMRRSGTRLAAARLAGNVIAADRAKSVIAEHTEMLALLRSSAEPARVEALVRRHREAEIAALSAR